MESEGRREETVRWQREVSGFGQKWKVFLEKNPLPIQQFLPNRHLLSPHGSIAASLSLVVQLVSVQLWRHWELMRQLNCLRCKARLFSPERSERSHFYSQGPFISKQTATSDCFVYDWATDFR